MKQDDKNIQPEEFDSNRVGYLLDSAILAEEGGNSRLAIHLYCAAFEASQDIEAGVDERTLSGLRQAWMLACEQGDRSTAETIFNDLAPYNSDEQTRTALAELQEMAMGQLGLKKEEMGDIAFALANEMDSTGIDIQALVERFADMQGLPLGKINLDAPLSAAKGDALQANSTSDCTASSGEPSQPAGGEFGADGMQIQFHYANLSGFESAKDTMRDYGIIDPSDEEMQGFLEQAKSFHGVSGPVLSQNFLFVGSSREDCGIFAGATANEIGWPVVTMIVDVNELGDGTIKVAAPIKRSLFGPPRITDLPNPCILVIQNIDILQDLFWSEEQAFNNEQGPSGCRRNEDQHRSSHLGKSPSMPAHNVMHPRPLQQEILGYLGALLARGGVFVIATSALSSAEHPLVLSEQLESLLGEPVEIAVEAPNLDERKAVLTTFALDHPSFHDLDRESLACLSEGMSRFEIFVSCRRAVEEAYSESLKNQRHQMVGLADILTQFAQFLAQGSLTYSLVEDYLVALFAADLENDLLDADRFSSQKGLDLESRENENENSASI